MKKITLTHTIFAGIILGIAGGSLLGPAILPVAEPLATLFLRLLRMVIMPLIITSILSGVLSIGTARGLGSLGLKTGIYYITTSLLAICTGQLLVNIFRPGAGASIGLQEQVTELPAADQSIKDLLFRIIPENPFQSIANGDVLPVIFFCILFGFFITRLEDDYRLPLTRVIQGAFEAMMQITRLVLWLAPLGVFGINAKLVATTGIGAFKSLGFYFLIVLAGLFIHALVSLPLLLKLVGRVKPFKHYRNLLPVFFTAFSTSSSMATLPVNLECTHKGSGVSDKITNFTLPIGATVNMDGTALYECVAVIFIAQVYGIELNFSQQLVVVMMSLLVSVGAAGIPMVGLVMMSIILRAVNLPLEGVGIILAVDRILDMFRTTVNVLSDSCGAVIVAHLEGEELEKIR